MAELNNPYEPPVALVADVPLKGAGPGTYIEGGRAVRSARGWAWITEGFGYFRRQAGMWVVLTIIFFLLLAALQVIPVIGSMAFPIVMPLLIAGFMIGCRVIEKGGELELAHLFAGFRHNCGQLVLISVIGAVLMLLAMVPLFIATGMTIGAASTGSWMSAVALGTGILLTALFGMALLIPINMALWFAPALVALQGQSAPRAIGQSFRGCLRNVVPFLLYAIILFFLAMIASLPAGLGWLVLAPVVICSVYAAYRDIFFQS